LAVCRIEEMQMGAEKAIGRKAKVSSGGCDEGGRRAQLRQRLQNLWSSDGTWIKRRYRANSILAYRQLPDPLCDIWEWQTLHLRVASV